MRTLLLSLTLAALSTALLGAVSPVKRGNLLVNGSFEEGPAVGDYLPVNVGSKQIKGWVVTRAQIDIVGPKWNPAHGKRWIDLHGTAGKGGISQTFATKPGRTYVVTFSLAGNPNGGERIKVVGVTAAGQRTSFSFDIRGKKPTNLGWVRKSWTFKAVSKRTTLEFFSQTKGTDGLFGPAIDNVSVVEG